MSLRYPVDSVKVSQGFGADPKYYGALGQVGHNGIDLAVPAETPVYAAEDGTVYFEGWGKNSSWMGSVAGVCVLIHHGDFYTGYAHLNSTVVSKGQRVTKGQLIGRAGQTGAASGPHVHFEVLGNPVAFSNGYAGRLNPAPYLAGTNQEGGDEMPIPDADNYYGRYGVKLALQLRGRELSRDEFRAALVGKTDLKAIEILSDNEEADRAQEWQRLGQIATADGWQQQIYDLQARASALEQERNAARDDAAAKAAAIITQAAQIEDLKVLAALKTDDTTNLNGLGTGLQWIIKRLGLTK